MKITDVSRNRTIYSSNVYLITGSWNTLDDKNTLIDVGRDPSVLEEIQNASTGFGKKRVEQVILTHNHYDHVSLLPEILRLFEPAVYAGSPHLDGVDVVLRGGENLRCGDRLFEIILTPGHSSDSLCCYCAEDGVLFAGDTPLVIQSAGGSYDPEFIDALENLCSRDIWAIYFGHGEPLMNRCNAVLQSSLENVRRSIR
jgi:glyoxylase-like metal-dependent hydrolase (beta-lactamase superfamily II)